MDKENVLDKLNSIFREELWGRIEPKDVGISKFKILDDLFNGIVSADLINDTVDVCVAHLGEHADSINASYLLGLIGYHTGRMDDMVHLKKLIDLFLAHHKWAVAEVIAEKILEYGENRMALKALATSLERMGRNKDAIPVWEDLLKIDRFDAEVAKKLAFSIVEDDPNKSVYYMKLSIEGYIKNNDYHEILSLWNKLVSVSWEDVPFFERIERMLVDAGQTDLAASLLKILFNKYRDDENPDQSIALLKKILTYTPGDTMARRDLVKFYEKKHHENSQYDLFLQLSKLNNFKCPVKHAIRDFENYIVFDRGNYVTHRAWGVGKIVEIDRERIVVDFKDKPGHGMSIQMALTSLTPISSGHIAVMEYEDFESARAMFSEDIIGFFDVLVRSYGGEVNVSEVKKDLVPRYIDEKGWSKWWTKVRTEIKKDPHFGFSEKKKNVIFMRDKPLTFADELLNRFTAAGSFSERLDAAFELINNVGTEDGGPVAPYFIDYFSDQVKGESHTKRILSYFILRGLARFADEKKLRLDAVRAEVIDYIKGSGELPLISMKISSYDYKKDFVNLIMESREDWTSISAEMLLETPVRIHKYIINNLIQSHAYTMLNGFIERVIRNAKQYPEIFIWAAKNLYTRAWDYAWLDYSSESLTLSYFRLMNELKKIETKGNRLKNMMTETIFDNDQAVLRYIVRLYDEPFLHKIYDLFRGVAYAEQSQIDKFLAAIRERYPDFKLTGAVAVEEDAESDIEKVIVSQQGRDRMMAELNRMVSVDLVNISRELSLVADVSGDVRENVEYNALMEKQAVLKMEINKLEAQMKKVEILNVATVSTETVAIGTVVAFEDAATGEPGRYTILGPWDSDYEKRILSYQSPIARAFLGRAVGDEIVVKMGDVDRRYRIVAIERWGNGAQ